MFQLNKCKNPAGSSLKYVVGINLYQQNLSVELRDALLNLKVNPGSA